MTIRHSKPSLDGFCLFSLTQSVGVQLLCHHIVTLQISLQTVWNAWKYINSAILIKRSLLPLWDDFQPMTVNHVDGWAFYLRAAVKHCFFSSLEQVLAQVSSRTYTVCAAFKMACRSFIRIKSSNLTNTFNNLHGYPLFMAFLLLCREFTYLSSKSLKERAIELLIPEFRNVNWFAKAVYQRKRYGIGIWLIGAAYD